MLDRDSLAKVIIIGFSVPDGGVALATGYNGHQDEIDLGGIMDKRKEFFCLGLSEGAQSLIVALLEAITQKSFIPPPDTVPKNFPYRVYRREDAPKYPNRPIILS